MRIQKNLCAYWFQAENFYFERRPINKEFTKEFAGKGVFEVHLPLYGGGMVHESKISGWIVRPDSLPSGLFEKFLSANAVLPLVWWLPADLILPENGRPRFLDHGLQRGGHDF